MYEHPQYKTHKGYKRTARNPLSRTLKSKGTATAQTGNLSVAGPKSLLRKRRRISPEAARLIAEAIRTMLKQ